MVAANWLQRSLVAGWGCGLRPRSALLAGGLRPAGRMPLCVLGLGSNLGNRAANLHRALRLLRETVGVRLERTSLLYDSSPQYVTEQPRFLNATCEITTPLPPHELLRTVKVRRLPHRRRHLRAAAAGR